MNDKDKNDLRLFFDGLSTNIKQAEKFRAIYNEQMAFDFNPLLRFIWMNENKASEILAFFA